MYLEFIVIKISTVIKKELLWNVTILHNIWIYTHTRYGYKLK